MVTKCVNVVHYILQKNAKVPCMGLQVPFTFFVWALSKKIVLSSRFLSFIILCVFTKLDFCWNLVIVFYYYVYIITLFLGITNTTIYLLLVMDLVSKKHIWYVQWYHLKLYLDDSPTIASGIFWIFHNGQASLTEFLI